MQKIASTQLAEFFARMQRLGLSRAEILDDFIFLQDGRVRMYAGVDETRSKRQTSMDNLFRDVFRC